MTVTTIIEALLTVIGMVMLALAIAADLHAAAAAISGTCFICLARGAHLNRGSR